MSQNAGRTMNTRQVIQNYALYVAFAGLNVVVSFLLLLFLANNLSTQEYAAYGYYTTLMGLVLIGVNWGHRESLFKFSSQQNMQQVHSLAHSYVPWVGGLLILAIAMAFIYPVAGSAAIAFILLYVLNTVSSLNRGLHRYLRDAMALPVYRSVWLLGCMGLLAWQTTDLSAVSVFFAAAGAALLSALVLATARIWSLLRPVNFELPFTHSNPQSRRTLFHFLLLEIATIAYIKLDVLLLRWISGSADQVAGYFFSVQLFEAAVLILAPVSYLFFNWLNQRSPVAGPSSVSSGKFITLLLTVIVLMNLGWWVAGEQLLTHLFPAYTGSFSVISIFMLTLFPVGLNLLLSHILFSRHQEWVFVKICAFGLIICLLLQLALIPLFQEYGAVAGRFITEVFILGMLLFWFGFRSKTA